MTKETGKKSGKNTATVEEITARWQADFYATETMKNTLRQCVTYAVVSGIPIEDIFIQMKEQGSLPARDKKSGVKQIEELRSLILRTFHEPEASMPPKRNRKKLQTIFIENDIREHPRTKEIRDRFPGLDVNYIENYKERFYHPSMDGRALILAKKRDTILLPGSPVCQSFGEEYFYYTSCVTGCPYDCEYCYLKGMYPSDDLIVYINIEDVFAETEKVLEKHEAYICISYDADLMTMENHTGYVAMWTEFARRHEGLRVECRTKCARKDLWKSLTPCDRMIFAFTLSPQEVIGRYEHGTPSLPERLDCIREGLEDGFSIRLCFDPMLAFSGWEEAYDRMLDAVIEGIDPGSVRDISVGSFRISQDYLRRLRQKEPDSPAVQYPFVNEGGVYRYPDGLQREMTDRLMRRLCEQVPEDRIFLLEK